MRESVENDKKFIRKVHQNAFDQSEGESVSQLVIDLLEDKTALLIFSFVAEQDNVIIGNVILSSVTIEGAEIVLVYGDPDYYIRTGFKSGHNLKPPHKLK